MKRAYEGLLKRYLTYFPCVSLVGARQCGKTTLLSQLPPRWKHFDLEKRADGQTIARDPDLFFKIHPDFVAIDEAQFLPELFPALRVAIDAHRNKKGRFVITGSSSPRLVQSISETLAGRVGLIEMAPLSLAESQGFSDTPFVESLLSKNPMKALMGLAPRLSIQAVHDYWFRGGYPEPWLSRDDGFRRAWMDQYVATYVERDLARLFPGLHQTRFQQFIQLLAGLSGTVINYSDVARALEVSAPTVRTWFDIAHHSFLWRTLPSHDRKTIKRVVKHPKGYLRDTGLLHHFLKIPDLPSLLAHPQMGRSWEGFVVEEIRRGFSAQGHAIETTHYRTSAGAEVDLILEGDFGLIPIEIKHTSFIPTQKLRPLQEFVREHHCPFGLVLHNGDRPLRLDEKTVAVPVACF